MSNFKITATTKLTQYNYTDDKLIVNGAVESQQSEVININGTAFLKTAEGGQGEYIGNFNGYMRDGEIRYSLSEMSRRDSNKVWDAIDEIEPYVTGQNANDGED